MILDVHQWPGFSEKKADLLPVHEWLEKGNGKLVYSNHKSFEKELTKKQKTVLKGYNQSGKARFFPAKQVAKEASEIKNNHKLKSNDIHILGLAKAARAKLLCSKDKNLHSDFKDILKGSVYQNAKHKRLLTKDACP